MEYSKSDLYGKILVELDYYYSTRKQICYPIGYPNMLIYVVHCAVNGSYEEASGAIERLRKARISEKKAERSDTRIMQDNICVRCGRPIPDDMRICLACGDYDEMQTFSQPARKPPKQKRYFRIVDECGWTYIIATDNMDMISANIALLVPHVRSAVEISREEFERSSA